MKNFSTKYKILFINLVFLAGLILLAINAYYPKNEQNSSIVTLIKLIGASRITEARLSGGFSYTPYVPLPKAEKTPLSDLEIDSNLAKPILPKNNLLNDSEVAQNLNLNSFATKSAKRGTESSNYNDYFLINPDQDLFNKLSRGSTEKQYSFSDRRLKVVEIEEFKNIVAKIVLADIKQNTLETAHALALVHIIDGNFKDAIERLEKAKAEESLDPYILNDLAVAYFNYGHEKENLFYIIKALSVIDKAFTQNTPIEEIQFNRALILESLQLSEAEKAWTDYLKIEKATNWHQEAENHLKIINTPSLPELWVKERKTLETAIKDKNILLAQEIINKFPHFARMHTINELIPAWGEAYLKENYIEAAQYLEIAKFIGKHLQVIHKDNLIVDIVSTITTSLEMRNVELTNKLATAYITHKEGERLAENAMLDKAEEAVLKAKKLFIECKDLAGKALEDIQLARIYVFRANFPIALTIIANFREVAEIKRYPYILGRACMLYGRIQYKLYEPQKALSALKIAQTCFELIEDYDEGLNTCSIFSFVYEQMGLLDDFWQNQYNAHKYINQISKIYLRITTHLITTEFFSLDLLKVSLYFLDDSLKTSLSSKIINDRFATLCTRSKVYYKLGNKKAAFDDITLAEECIKSASEDSVKLGFEQYLSVIKGNLSFLEDPKSAIKFYDVALNTSNGKLETYELTNIYLSRAKAYVLIGDYDKAEEDLKNSIKEYERVRNTLPFERERVSFLEQVQSAYDEIILFQLEKRNQQSLAFYYSEAKRTRALLDLIASNKRRNPSRKVELPEIKTTPYTLKEIQGQIPKHTSIIEYTLLGKNLLIWIIEQNNFKLFQLEIDQRVLEENINSFRKAIDNNLLKDELISYSSPLFDKLIAPILPNIPTTNTIAIIPDKNLYEVPFAAIINPLTNKFLIDDFPLTISPSATIFISSLKQDELLRKIKTPEILLVGNPTFERKAFPLLSYLPNAEKEVDAIAKIYPKALVLKNKAATKKAFLDFAPRANLIHFAGHAIANSNSPLFSQLIFAKDDTIENSSDSSLRAYELYNLHLAQTRLVILAACNTASGQRLQSEGVISIARPFLANNVPAVVASLWEADDLATKELFSKFYISIISGEDPESALRSAQLSLINNTNTNLQQPKKWAAFVLLGGVSRKQK